MQLSSLSLSPNTYAVHCHGKILRQAWLSLYNTYATPSHGHLMQVSDLLDHLHEGSQSIIEYIQYDKSLSDTLFLINTLIVPNLLTDKILSNLVMNLTLEVLLYVLMKPQSLSMSFMRQCSLLKPYEAWSCQNITYFCYGQYCC